MQSSVRNDTKIRIITRFGTRHFRFSFNCSWAMSHWTFSHWTKMGNAESGNSLRRHLDLARLHLISPETPSARCEMESHSFEMPSHYYSWRLTPNLTEIERVINRSLTFVLNTTIFVQSISRLLP